MAATKGPGGASRKGKSASGRASKVGRYKTAEESGRYTAPIPKEMRSSAPWVPYMIVTLFTLGVLVILLNYLGVLGHASNVYLFVGLGLIVSGFIASTRWH